MKVAVDTRMLSDCHCEKRGVLVTVLKGGTHKHNVMRVMRQALYNLPLFAM